MKKISPFFKVHNKKTNQWFNDVGIYPCYGFLVMNDNDAMEEISDSGNNEDWDWYLDEEEINIKDLYFGCKNYNFNTKRFENFNLFNSMRVLHSIAIYRTRGDELEIDNPLRFCFGDLWGHVEFEMAISGLFDDESFKVSLWDMYVEPNADYLMSLVNSVSKESCEEFLEKYK